MTDERDALGAVDAVALALVAGGFWLVAGGPGLVAAATVGAVRLFLPSAYAFAIGVVGAVALVPDPTVSAAPLVTGLFVVLVAPAAGARIVGGTLAGALGLTALVAGVSAATGRLWLDAVTLAGVVALVGYLLHRYALVRLGLAEGSA